MKRFLSGTVFCFAILTCASVLSPAAPHAGERDAVDAYTGMIAGEDRLSISIQNADIQSVLKALSLKKKLNIVAGRDVTGNISVNLYDLPLKDALDAIITFNGFSYTWKDDIIFVSKELEGANDRSGAQVMTFKLNYADIDEVEKVITKLLSESAKVTVYKPEKTLIVDDAPRNLERVKSVLDTLDIPPKQVLIETRILEVRLNDDTSLGIDWRDTFSGFFNSSGNIFTQGFTANSQGFFFDLVNGDFNLFLDALQARSEVNTLSAPKLLALDNKEANIIIGDKLGYYVTTATEASVLQSVEFLDTGTQLILTPHITNDGNILMEIHPEVSDGIIVSGLPTKTTTEVTTSLMAPDGGTIFIGGLIRDRKEDIKNRVPLLGSIPVMGALFSKTQNITVRTEIVVLITPHVISAANKDILERDTPQVDEIEQNLKRERSLKELIPGIE